MSDEEDGALIVLDLAGVKIDEERFELLKKAIDEGLRNQLIKLELAEGVKFDWQNVLDRDELKERMAKANSRRLKAIAQVQLAQARRGQTVPNRPRP